MFQKAAKSPKEFPILLYHNKKMNHNRHIVHSRNNVFNIIFAFQIVKIPAEFELYNTGS